MQVPGFDFGRVFLTPTLLEAELLHEREPVVVSVLLSNKALIVES